MSEFSRELDGLVDRRCSKPSLLLLIVANEYALKKLSDCKQQWIPFQSPQLKLQKSCYPCHWKLKFESIGKLTSGFA